MKRKKETTKDEILNVKIIYSMFLNEYSIVYKRNC